MGFDKRRGLHQLYPHRWATEYTLTGSLMEKNRPLPKLVQSVSTNGIEVKVLVYKMVKKPPPKDKPQYAERAKGIDNLVHAGYTAVNDVLDIF